VFSSDIYSLGVTMYQMLTGELPYDTPAPSDLERLRRGELVTAPRMRMPHIPVSVDAVVMRALSGQVSTRYQRAEDFLQDLLGARRELARRPAQTPAPALGAVHEAYAAPPRPAAPAPPAERPQMRRITPARLRTREITASRFCWNCRKPLPARASKCPFCSESQ